MQEVHSSLRQNLEHSLWSKQSFLLPCPSPKPGCVAMYDHVQVHRNNRKAPAGEFDLRRRAHIFFRLLNPIAASCLERGIVRITKASQNGGMLQIFFNVMVRWRVSYQMVQRHLLGLLHSLCDSIVLNLLSSFLNYKRSFDCWSCLRPPHNMSPSLSH